MIDIEELNDITTIMMDGEPRHDSISSIWNFRCGCEVQIYTETGEFVIDPFFCVHHRFYEHTLKESKCSA